MARLIRGPFFLGVAWPGVRKHGARDSKQRPGGSKNSEPGAIATGCHFGELNWGGKLICEIINVSIVVHNVSLIRSLPLPALNSSAHDKLLNLGIAPR